MRVNVLRQAETPRPMREAGADVPPELEAVIMCCLAKAPADRYKDASRLEAALRDATAQAGDAAIAPTGSSLYSMPPT